MLMTDKQTNADKNNLLILINASTKQSFNIHVFADTRWSGML